MATIPSNDVTRYRSDGIAPRAVFNFTPCLSDLLIATADINQSAFTFPVAQLTIDNKSTDFDTLVHVGQGVRIVDTATGAITLWGVVRKPVDGTTFYIDAKSNGASGVPQAIRYALADNQRIEVYNVYPLWGLYSRVAGTSFLKQYDIAYTNQGSAPDPIVRMGKHRAPLVVSDTDTAIEAFDATGSHDWNSSISSYLWDAGGGTIVTGTTTTGAVEIEFAPSQTYYVVRCTVTLASGKSFTGIRYVWCRVDNPDSIYAPDSYRYSVGIDSDTQTETAREMVVTITGESLPDDFIHPFMTVFMRDDTTFDMQAHPLDAPELRVSEFVGYATERELTQRFRLVDNAVSFAGTLAFAQRLPSTDQAMIERPNPSNWSQVSSVLSNPIGAVYYLCRWHIPNILALHDFEWDSDDLLQLRRGAYGFKTVLLGSQLQEVATIARARIGSKSDGTIVLSRRAAWLDNTARNALDILYQFQPQDLRNELKIPVSFRQPLRNLIVGAFSYNGAAKAVRSRAPGAEAEQGDAPYFEQDVSITAGDEQTKCNELSGHIFAWRNNPVPTIRLDLLRPADFVEPILNDWLTLAIPNDYQAYGLLLDKLASGNTTTNTAIINGVEHVIIRCQPKAVQREWSATPGGVNKSLSVDVEPETFGQPGIFEPIPTGGAAAYLPIGGMQKIALYDAQPLGLDTELAYMLAIVTVNETNELAFTRNALASKVEWENISGLVTGEPVAMDWNYHCAFIANGYVSTADSLEAYVLTWDGANVRIYLLTDLLNTQGATLQETYSASILFTPRLRGYIKSDRVTANFVVATWITGAGADVVYVRSTDGGATWSGSETVIESAQGWGAPYGLIVDNSIQLIPAEILAGVYGLYRATTTGGAFAQVSGFSGSVITPELVHNNDADGYATQIGIEPTIYVDTFDAPGTDFPRFSTGASFSAGTGTAGTGGIGPYGNPGDCVFAIGWICNTFAQVRVSSTYGQAGGFFPTGFTITKVRFDARAEGSLGTQNATVSLTSSFGIGSVAGTTTPGILTSTSWQTFEHTFTTPLTSTSDTQQFGVRVTSALNVSSSQTWDLYLDNIEIETGGATPGIYRLNSIGGAITFTDITPAADELARDEYALGASDDALTVIASDEDGNKRLYESVDNGANWTYRRGVPQLIGVKRGGDIRLFWGRSNFIGLSSNGVDVFDRTGNMGEIIGYGDVKEVLALLS